MGFIGYCPTCKKMQESGTFNLDKCKACKSVFLPKTTFDAGAWNKYSAEEQQDMLDAFERGENLDNLKDGLIKKERDKVENRITTSSSFEGREIEEYCGTVSGTDIYLVGGLVGGGLANQEYLFGNAFANAKKKMFDKAKSIGANAIVGMQTNITSPGNLNNIIVITTGTAVKLKDNGDNIEREIVEKPTVDEQTEKVVFDEWKCTWCGKSNKNEARICSCGCARGN